MKNLSIISICLTLFIISIPSVAENSDTNDSYSIETDLVSLLNPLGISLSVTGFHKNTYHYDTAPLWDGLYYQTGLQLNINPAFVRAGLHVEWLPVAVLKLRLQYDRLYFSGSNGSLLVFSSADELFGDDELLAREGDEVSDYGNRLLLRFELRAKLKNLIIRNVTDLMQYQFPGAGPYYLEREYEILMASNDDVVSNQIFFLYESKNEKYSNYVGPYHDYVHVSKSDLIRERLGVTWFQEFNEAFGHLEKPRWYVQLGMYLNDPNRADEYYLVFGVGGDFNL